MTDDTDEVPATSTLTYEPPRWVVTPAADVGAIALRLLGVKALIDLLTNFAQLPLYIMVSETSTRTPLIAIGVSIAWYAALAAVLLVAARPIAEAIFGRRTVAAHDLGVGAWMMLIVSGAGLTFALFSLQDAVMAVGAIVERIRMNAVPARTSAVEAAELVRLIPPILKSALGVVLFLRPSLLVTPWLRGVERTS